MIISGSGSFGVYLFGVVVKVISCEESKIRKKKGKMKYGLNMFWFWFGDCFVFVVWVLLRVIVLGCGYNFSVIEVVNFMG